MEDIKKDLEKRYKISCLESEVYLWQLCIFDNPGDKECYEISIKSNLDKLKELR